jgi:hypothetical protein
MESDTTIRDADLDLLLAAENDRDEPFLVPRRVAEEREPKEELDEQILAGLVNPF